MFDLIFYALMIVAFVILITGVYVISFNRGYELRKKEEHQENIEALRRYWNKKTQEEGQKWNLH